MAHLTDCNGNLLIMVFLVRRHGFVIPTRDSSMMFTLGNKPLFTASISDNCAAHLDVTTCVLQSVRRTTVVPSLCMYVVCAHVVCAQMVCAQWSVHLVCAHLVCALDLCMGTFREL